MELTRGTDRASLVWSPHPLLACEGRVVAFDPPTGKESLRAYLVRCGVDLSGPVVVSVNGGVIPLAWLDRVRPKPGTMIAVRAALAGGGGKSNVLQIVALIAVAVVAPYAAQAALGTTAGAFAATALGGVPTFLAVAGGVVTLAGSMLINKLFGPPKMDLGRGFGESGSPTYSLSNSNNRARPYAPLALTLGTHRVMLDLAARPYAVFEGADQYLYQVFHVGLHGGHPLRVEDLRVGETPITDYADVLTEYSVDAMPGLMPYNVDTVPGAELTVAAGPVVRTTSTNTTRIEVDVSAVCYIAKGSGLKYREVQFRLEYRPIGAPDWLPFTASTDTYPAYWSRGEWVSTDPGAQYNPDGTVQTYPDGSIVFAESQKWIQSGYDANRSPTAHTDGSGGWWWRPYAERPVSDPAPPAFDDEAVPVRTMGGSSSSPIRRTYGVDVASGQYEVRMERITPDETDSSASSSLAWSTLKSYQSEPGSFEGQTFLALKIKASGQLQGTVDTLNALVSQPISDGTFSRNPADLYLQFARGYRVGGRLLWGAGLADADIDLTAIAAWRAWCAAHGLTCSLHLDSGKSVWEVMSAIARIGRASPSWGSGSLGVIWDAEDQPVVAMFGPSNIARGSFEVAYQATSAADEVVLTFVDADAGYTASQVRRLAPGVVTPTSSASTELWGCTSREQAIRECNLMVAHQVYRTRAVKWRTDMEGLVVTRGDVVALSHDLTQWGTSGRLMGGTTTTLELDRAITLDPAGNWITVVSPDGDMTTCRVQYVAGEVDSLTLLDPLPSPPDADSPMDWRWLCDYLPTPGKRVKIIDIRPASLNQVEIVAMDDPDEYYDAEWGIYPPVPTRKWTSSRPVIAGLKLTQEVVRTGIGAGMQMAVTWSETGNVAVRVVRYSISGGPMQTIAPLDAPECRFQIPDFGSVTVVVDLYDAGGVVGADGHVEVTQTIETLLPALEVELPTPLSPVIYCTPDTEGNISRARVRVSFAELVNEPVTGMAFFVAGFPFRNAVTIASGGTTDTLVMDSLAELSYGTLAILAGSTRTYIVNTTAGSPNDVTWNGGGRYWARLPGGEWSKCTGLDMLGYYFDPPFDADPAPGQTLEWVEVAWADERSGQQDKLALLTNGTQYEIIRWGTLDDNGPGGAIRVTGCQRGQEGTTIIDATGCELHYLPALGPGTSNLDFPATAFVEDGGTYTAEIDLDFKVPAGQYISLAAAVYRLRNDGTFARSVIVPATYGGPL